MDVTGTCIRVVIWYRYRVTIFTELPASPPLTGRIVKVLDATLKVKWDVDQTSSFVNVTELLPVPTVPTVVTSADYESAGTGSSREEVVNHALIVEGDIPVDVDLNCVDFDIPVSDEEEWEEEEDEEDEESEAYKYLKRKVDERQKKAKRKIKNGKGKYTKLTKNEKK